MFQLLLEGFPHQFLPLHRIFKFFQSRIRTRFWLVPGSFVMLSALIQKHLILLLMLFKRGVYLTPFCILFGKTLYRIVWLTSINFMLALLDPVMIFKMIQKIFCQMEDIFSFAKIRLIPKNLFNQVQSGLVSLLHGKLEFLPCIHTELLSFLLTRRKSMVFSEPFQTIPQLELNLMLKFMKIIQEVLFK